MNNNIPEPNTNQGPTMQPQNNLNITQSINPQQEALNNLNSEQPINQPPLPPMPPKKSKGPLVIIILLILIILGLAGYICYDKFIAKDNKCDVEKTTETDNKKILLKDKTKDIVYSSLKDKIKVSEDGYFYYNIPQVNINSSDAQVINDEINSKLKKEYDDVKKALEESKGEYIASMFEEIDYKYYINDNILSLFIYSKGEVESDSDYYIYNIDIYTGKKVSNEDILKIKQLNEETFKSKMIDAFKSLEKHMTDGSHGSDEFAKNQYNKNISNLKESSLDSYQIYLNDKKELCSKYKR